MGRALTSPLVTRSSFWKEGLEKTTDREHRGALNTSLNSTGVDTAAVVQQSLSGEWQRVGRQAGLLLHLQDGTSRPTVLSTTDVAVLCRSIHARHRQALLVEHVPAVEDHHAEGLRCICWEDGRKA